VLPPYGLWRTVSTAGTHHWRGLGLAFAWLIHHPVELSAMPLAPSFRRLRGIDESSGHGCKREMASRTPKAERRIRNLLVWNKT
jgi:hypothetical protein